VINCYNIRNYVDNSTQIGIGWNLVFGKIIDMLAISKLNYCIA
jgi:hypothetical protein